MRPVTIGRHSAVARLGEGRRRAVEGRAQLPGIAARVTLRATGADDFAQAEVCDVLATACL